METVNQVQAGYFILKCCNCLVLLAGVDVLSAPEHLGNTFDYVPVLVDVISCTIIPVFKTTAPTRLILHSCHMGISEEITAWL